MSRWAGVPERPDPAASLLRRAGIGLAAVTLATVTALVIAVGVATAVTATTLMLETIDRALDIAVADPDTLHGLVEGEVDEGDANRGSVVGGADTFVLLTDAQGTLLGSSSDLRLAGLPDRDAVVASTSGTDRRRGTYGGLEVRLLTRPLARAQLSDEDEIAEEIRSRGPLYVQAGFVLTLHVQQERQLLAIIAAVGLLGIAGAALVTVVVTRRALGPIREAFATERRFVAAASHELRTPVSIIRASAEILERERLVEPAGRPLVEDIVGETERMGRLVGDMLALASAESGTIALEPRPLELGAWFSDLGRRARSVVEGAGLTLVANSAATGLPATAIADPDRLDQLVLILLDNAVKHSPPHGRVALELAADAGSGAATISVSDEGPGITPMDRERIFEPFARLPGTSRSGTGLGLAIARQLAARHGGHLEVVDQARPGATFRLRLPLVRIGRWPAGALDIEPDG